MMDANRRQQLRWRQQQLNCDGVVGGSGLQFPWQKGHSKTNNVCISNDRMDAAVMEAIYLKAKQCSSGISNISKYSIMGKLL